MRFLGSIPTLLIVHLFASGCAIQTSKSNPENEETFTRSQTDPTPFTSTRDDEVVDEIPIDTPVEESSEAPLAAPPEADAPEADVPPPVDEQTLGTETSPIVEDLPTEIEKDVESNLDTLEQGMNSEPTSNEELALQPNESESPVESVEKNSETSPPPSLEEVILVSGETVVVKTVSAPVQNEEPIDETDGPALIIEEVIPPAPLGEFCYKTRILRHPEASSDARISIFRKSDVKKEAAIYTENVDLRSDRKELAWFELPYFENPEREPFILEVSMDTKGSMSEVTIHPIEDCKRSKESKKKKK